jgi:hypothetical protein
VALRASRLPCRAGALAASWRWWWTSRRGLLVCAMPGPRCRWPQMLGHRRPSRLVAGGVGRPAPPVIAWCGPAAAYGRRQVPGCGLAVLALDEFCPHTMHFSSLTSIAGGATRRRAPRESRVAECRNAPGVFRRRPPGSPGCPAPPARGEKAQQTLRRVVTIGGRPVANRLSRRANGENVTSEVTNSPSTLARGRPRAQESPPTPLPSMPSAAQRRKTPRGRPKPPTPQHQASGSAAPASLGRLGGDGGPRARERRLPLQTDRGAWPGRASARRPDLCPGSRVSNRPRRARPASAKKAPFRAAGG